MGIMGGASAIKESHDGSPKLEDVAALLNRYAAKLGEIQRRRRALWRERRRPGRTGPGREARRSIET